MGSAWGRFTPCVRDLLFHLYTDARRGLAALCTLVDARTPVDRDWSVTGRTGSTGLIRTSTAFAWSMDLVVAVSRPGPAPELMRVARSVVEALAGTSLPQGWDDTTAVLVGTGRLVRTPRQRASLGSTGGRLRVFR